MLRDPELEWGTYSEAEQRRTDFEAPRRKDLGKELSLTGSQINITDDVDLLLGVMPPLIRQLFEDREDRHDLLEIVIDLGRPPEARFVDQVEILSPEPVSHEDIDYVLKRVGKFTEDNRAGIERTLHRISAIRNRIGEIIGLTCRVGRAVFGTVDILEDVIKNGRSLLLLGRPGVGKTTLLRESARVLADEYSKRVVIVDTSNEIGGDGDIPHPGIGRARRMQVPSPDRQHAVMIEAVENHMPEVVVIDEIGTEAEALAARTIAERGVQLIATAHGNTLENLLQNPTLADLVGGIHVVTLSDEEARRRHRPKTILERKAPPTFNILVEIQDRDRLAVHHTVAEVVDAILARLPLQPEIRQRTTSGGIEICKLERCEPKPSEPSDTSWPPKKIKHGTLRIFSYGVSRSRLERAILKLKVPAEVVTEIERADVVLSLKSQKKRQPRRLREFQSRGVPLHVIKGNTIIQMENYLRGRFGTEVRLNGVDGALKEAESAVNEVLRNGHPIELAPQYAHLRRLQHQLAVRFGLVTESKGKDPFRRVVIYPS
jgi:stage III sporulation protein SpoIIIAA